MGNAESGNTGLGPGHVRVVLPARNAIKESPYDKARDQLAAEAVEKEDNSLEAGVTAVLQSESSIPTVSGLIRSQSNIALPVTKGRREKDRLPKAESPMVAKKSRPSSECHRTRHRRQGSSKNGSPSPKTSRSPKKPSTPPSTPVKHHRRKSTGASPPLAGAAKHKTLPLRQHSNKAGSLDLKLRIRAHNSSEGPTNSWVNSSDSANLEDLIAAACTAADKHDQNEAIRCLLRAVELYPTSALPYFHRAKMAFETKRINEALYHIGAGLVVEPNHIPSWLLQGDIFRSMEKPMEALESFTKATEVDTTNLPAWKKQIGLLIENDQLSNALETCNVALKVLPESDVLMVSRASILARQGSSVEASKVVQEVMKMAPGNASAWLLAGSLAMEEEQYVDATRYFDKAILLDSSNPAPRFERARASLAQGAAKECVLFANEALKLNNSFVKAWQLKGRAFASQKKLRESIKFFTFALRFSTVHEEQIDILLDLAVAESRAGNHEQSAKAYKTAFDLNPGQMVAFEGYAHESIILGNFEAALSIVEQRLDASRGETHWYKAQALLGLGRPLEALEAAETTCKLLPDFSQAWSTKGLSLMAMIAHKEHDKPLATLQLEAIDCFDRATSLDPNSASAWVHRAEAMIAAGKPLEMAMPFYEKAIQISKGKETDALAALGAAYRRSKDYAKAPLNINNAYFTLQSAPSMHDMAMVRNLASSRLGPQKLRDLVIFANRMWLVS